MEANLEEIASIKDQNKKLINNISKDKTKKLTEYIIFKNLMNYEIFNLKNLYTWADGRAGGAAGLLQPAGRRTLTHLRAHHQQERPLLGRE